jgi:acyl carrier protein
MTRVEVADRLEAFVRSHFAVAVTDHRFTRSVPLFDTGYVDSIGAVELLAFLEETFGVQVPDDELLSDDFSTIDGIAAIVHRRLESGGRSAGPGEGGCGTANACAERA